MKKKKAALVAPTYKEYFTEEEWPVLEEILKEIGFSYAVPIETMCQQMIEEEFEKWNHLPEGERILISSCCPKIPRLIEREYPELMRYVSETESPMTMAAAQLRDQEADLEVVFFGPCKAKGKEWDKRHNCPSVDCMYTFEELWDMCPKEKHRKKNSMKNTMVGSVGGIAYQMEHSAYAPDKGEVKYYVCAGLKQCRTLLEQIRNGEIKNGYIEASYCEKGCAGANPFE